jgi:hypothetical protein
MTTNSNAPTEGNKVGASGDQSRRAPERSALMLARTSDNPLRRRREAALRCPPLHDGVRDPLDRAAHPGEPSTYGMNEVELRRYANDLVRRGWSLWEIRQRLAITPRPQCFPCCRHQEAAA